MQTSKLGKTRSIGLSVPANNTEYDRRALAWLEATDSTLEITFSRNGRYLDDTYPRDIYDIILRRGNRRYSFTFGQCYMSSRPTRICPCASSRQPTAHEVLSALETASPGTFEDFCEDFGHDTDSRAAEREWRRWADAWAALSGMYTEAELARVSGLCGHIVSSPRPQDSQALLIAALRECITYADVKASASWSRKIVTKRLRRVSEVAKAALHAAGEDTQ